MDLMRYFGEAVRWFAVLTPVVVVAAVVVSMRSSRGTGPHARRRVAVLDVAIGLAFLGIAVVTRSPGAAGGPHTAGVELVPVVDMVDTLTSSASANVALRIIGMTVLLFVPLGFLLALRLGRIWRAVGIGLVTSVTMELLQGVVPAVTRVAHVDDAILNTLGAALGAAVATAVLRIIQRNRPLTSRRQPMHARPTG